MFSSLVTNSENLVTELKTKSDRQSKVSDTRSKQKMSYTLSVSNSSIRWLSSFSATYLRQLSIGSFESIDASLKEVMNLTLLFLVCQINTLQLGCCISNESTWEDESNGRHLLRLGQHVDHWQPNVLVLNKETLLNNITHQWMVVSS